MAYMIGNIPHTETIEDIAEDRRHYPQENEEPAGCKWGTLALRLFLEVFGDGARRYFIGKLKLRAVLKKYPILLSLNQRRRLARNVVSPQQARQLDQLKRPLHLLRSWEAVVAAAWGGSIIHCLKFGERLSVPSHNESRAARSKTDE